MPPSPDTPLLQIKGISKTFGAVRALRDVQLSVTAGEIHALMGENGAGKSTLMKILSGAYHADPGGEIRVNGQVVAITGPLVARAAGISIIYQELALAPNLTAAENIYMGEELSKSGLMDRAAMNAGAGEVLARLGASFGPATLVSDLTLAERQLVEIARAVRADCRILVMDEPTTTLSSRETEKLFALVRRLRADGMAIIYISHRMAEVYELADRVSVLRDGTYVGTLTREETTPERLVMMMVGRELSGFYTKAHVAPERGAVVLDVKDVADGVRVHGCSLQVHAGEVLGLAGLVGAGRTELARLVYGADRKLRGTVAVSGRVVNIRTPQDAIEAGLVYLTEDRKAQGLFLDMAVSENINIGVIGRDARAGGLLDRGRARSRAAAAIKALAIRVASPAIEVGSLSGGNQQKVLLSRLLETQPRVLILDEPTRGVDIGAKSEIYRIIDQLARNGVGVLVISSELPELVGIADRVMVMREGHIVGEVGGQGRPPITQEAVIALATGAAAAPDRYVA
jgi:ribose transport system ATP-binding protein